MSVGQKRELKTAEYMARAREASALAEASALDRVRERHEQAAARWLELARDNEDTGPHDLVRSFVPKVFSTGKE